MQPYQFNCIFLQVRISRHYIVYICRSHNKTNDEQQLQQLFHQYLCSIYVNEHLKHIYVTISTYCANFINILINFMFRIHFMLTNILNELYIRV
jgi:hypothetical protein